MKGNRNLKAKHAKYVRQRGDAIHAEYTKAHYIAGLKPMTRDGSTVQYVTKGPRMMRDAPLAMGPLVKARETISGGWSNRPHKGARVLSAV
jgi:hypothetical protein